MLDLKLKNHGSLAMLMHGRGGRTDIDVLVNMVNIVEALFRLGFGQDYGDVMELHDAQMDVIVLKDMERAIELVNKEYQLRRMTPIVEDK